MTALPSSVVWKRAVPATIAVAGLLFAWAADRRSLERANRLYREGDLQAAATIYADRLGLDPASAQLRYNFATALLGLRDERAGEELARVSTPANDRIQVRALYNLGLWNLTAALSAEGTDSARAHAVSAVEADKSVLRLRPGHADAAWNLAIALRVLDSVDARNDQRGSEAVEAARSGALVATDAARDVSKDEHAPDEPRHAEVETAARAGAIAPLSMREASQILGTGHRDPTMMVGKLMALEGRTLRSRASER